MNNDEKILKALESLQADVKDVKGQKNTATKDDLKGMATKEDLERLEDGQMQIEREIYGVQREQVAIKGMIQLMNHNLVGKAQNHEKRIENLEEHTGTPNPTKH